MSASARSDVTVVVLAAGEGKRMRSATPKVLHTLCGDTMLGHVVRAARALEPARLLVVVGAGREYVTDGFDAAGAAVHAVVQTAPGGTGHAVRAALEAYPVPSGTVVVVPGDAPLLRAETLALLATRHAESGAAATILTARLADPTGYGRIVRDVSGSVRAIVEENDADERTKQIDEVGVSVYAFAAETLAAALGRLSPENAQGEEYLTDVIGLLVSDGAVVGALAVPDPVETLGVNDQVQLAVARRAFRDRLVARAMLAGVTVTDPDTTWMGIGVTYEPDAVIHQNTQLHGATHLGAGACVGPNSTLTDTKVGAGATVSASTCVSSVIGPASTVGPYAHLRAGTVLGTKAKVGAFVETKAAEIGDGAKVPHLAYVGDAAIGDRSNIGCGTVFVNYDGVTKQRTVVGKDVKIGSNNSLIAPVTVGDGAYTGADAVIRHDVPPGALAYSANEQVTRTGWVRDNRPSADRGHGDDAVAAVASPPATPPASATTDEESS